MGRSEPGSTALVARHILAHGARRTSPLAALSSGIAMPETRDRRPVRA